MGLLSPPRAVCVERADEYRVPPPHGSPHSVPLPGSKVAGRSEVYRNWRFKDGLCAGLDPNVCPADLEPSIRCADSRLQCKTMVEHFEAAGWSPHVAITCVRMTALHALANRSNQSLFSPNQTVLVTAPGIPRLRLSRINLSGPTTRRF